MRLHNMFKKTGEKITSIHSRNRRKPEAPEGILKKCNKCGAAILTDEVINGKYICPKCHGYFRIPAYKRIELVTDAGSFEEWDAKIDEGERPENPLDFRGYTEKVEALRVKKRLPVQSSVQQRRGFLLFFLPVPEAHVCRRESFP